MSNRTLRSLYAGMVRGRASVQGSESRARLARAARADVACFAAGLVGLGTGDVVLGCRKDGVLDALRGGPSLPVVPEGIGRLYAAAGSAMTFRASSERVTMAFFERHEVGGAGWAEGLRLAAGLPVVLMVLPRWKGKDAEDVCVQAQKAGVPGIAVDAADAIALYRVAQESLVRARMGGGAALIEGVWFRLAGEAEAHGTDAVQGLAKYLLGRRIASESWLGKVGSAGAPRGGMSVDDGA